MFAVRDEVSVIDILERQHLKIERLISALREIEELATDTPDEAAMEGALDAIRSCCEGALVNHG